jgi:hypothetical protein
MVSDQTSKVLKNPVKPIFIYAGQAAVLKRSPDCVNISQFHLEIIENDVSPPFYEM